LAEGVTETLLQWQLLIKRLATFFCPHVESKEWKQKRCWVILSTWRFFNLIFCQLPSCQLAILSTCHLVNLPSCQLAILSTCHLVNLPFCQLPKGYSGTDDRISTAAKMAVLQFCITCKKCFILSPWKRMKDMLMFHQM
jgi:hypothetical protein